MFARKTSSTAIQGGLVLERAPARWLRFVTSEIRCRRRSVLLDESIFEGVREVSEALQIQGDQR
jgi:hypothetical protein